MFSKWQYKLMIKNTLDRDLKLDSLRIPYGKKGSVNETIPAGGSGVCTIYSSGGEPIGLEFYVTYSDVYKQGEAPYGSFTVYVDMPFWKSKNTSTCDTNGIIKVDGFRKVPNGNHDFENPIIVTTTL